MKQVGKSKKLDNVTYEVRGPVVDEAARMQANGIDVLKLNIGNPGAFGFRAPEKLVKKMSECLVLADPYSDSRGLLGARQAIVKYCENKGIKGVTVDDIYTGNGVSELITVAMQALLDPEDEILIPAPDYPLWTASATMSGGTVVHYLCDEDNGWQPSLADIESKVTPKTKAIVVINPNNPTGALYGDEVLRGIVDIARKNDLILFADEIYDRMLMDGLKHTALASLAGDVFTVSMNGLSKSHKSCGYRIGWMVLSGDKERAHEYIDGINLLASMRLCSNVPGQHVIATALEDEHPDADLLPGGRIYEQRECIMNAIERIPGLSAVKPSAAFYVFPKIDAVRYNITDDTKFALDLLKAKHILFVQGSGFNYKSPDHFRIVFLPEAAELERAMTELGDFLSTYRQG